MTRLSLGDFIAGVLTGILLTLPLWPDPYHHKKRVNFWLWAYRELDELLHGEKK